jgi:hypothetical protein
VEGTITSFSIRNAPGGAATFYASNGGATDVVNVPLWAREITVAVGVAAVAAEDASLTSLAENPYATVALTDQQRGQLTALRQDASAA